MFYKIKDNQGNTSFFNTKTGTLENASEDELIIETMPFVNSLAIAKFANGKFGIIDKDRKNVLNEQLSRIERCGKYFYTWDKLISSDGKFVLSIGGLADIKDMGGGIYKLSVSSDYTFLDSAGNFVNSEGTPYQQDLQSYDVVFPLSNSFFKVYKDNKAFLYHNGKCIRELTQFYHLTCISPDVLVFLNGFINMKTNEVFNNVMVEIAIGQYLLTKYGNLYGLYTSNGKKLLECKYRSIKQETEAIFTLELGSKHSVKYDASKESFVVSIWDFNRWFGQNIKSFEPQDYEKRRLDKYVSVDLDWCGDFKWIPSPDMAYAQIIKEGKVGCIDEHNTILFLQDFDTIEYFNGEFGIALKKSYKNCFYIINDKGNIISDSYQDIQYCWYSNNFIVTNEEGNKGVIETNGKILIPFLYKKIEEVDRMSFNVSMDGKMSMKLLTIGGNFILNVNDVNILLAPNYNAIYDFHSGLAKVLSNDNKIGFINELGKEVIKCKWNIDQFSVSDYNGDYILIEAFDKQCKIDREGNFLATMHGNELKLSVKYLFIGDIYHGKAIVYDGENYGVIDEKGEDVIPCKYATVHIFEDGSIETRDLYDSQYILTKDGEMQPCFSSFKDVWAKTNPMLLEKDLECNEYCLPEREVIFVSDKEYNRGIYDRYGDVVVPMRKWEECRFVVDSPTVTQFHCEMKNTLFDEQKRETSNHESLEVDYDIYGRIVPLGLVDTSIIAIKETSIQNVFAVKKEEGWGYYNLRLKEYITPCIYAECNNGTIEFPYTYNYRFVIDEYGNFFPGLPKEYCWCNPSFKDGYLSVKNKDGWGVVDKNFKIVIPCEYQCCIEFVGDYAVVIKDRKCGVIDKDNNMILPCKYSYVHIQENGILCYGESLDYCRQGFVFQYAKNLNTYNGWLHSSLAGSNDYKLCQRCNYEDVSRTHYISDVHGNKSENTYNCEDLQYLSVNLFKFKKNKVWGFVSRDKKINYPASFDSIKFCDKNRLYVGKKDKQSMSWGVIDLQGNVLIDISHCKIQKLCEDIFYADNTLFNLRTGYQKYCDGELICSNNEFYEIYSKDISKYIESNEESHHYLKLNYDGGLYDCPKIPDFDWCIKLNNDTFLTFQGRYHNVKLGIYDKLGNVLMQPKSFGYISKYKINSQGFAINNMYINNKGEIITHNGIIKKILPSKYIWCTKWTDGYLIACENPTIGSSEWRSNVLDCNLDEISELSNCVVGYIADDKFLCKDKNYYIYDLIKKNTIKLPYDHCWILDNGFIKVCLKKNDENSRKTDSLYGIIDSCGMVILPVEQNGIYEIEDYNDFPSDYYGNEYDENDARAEYYAEKQRIEEESRWSPW